MAIRRGVTLLLVLVALAVLGAAGVALMAISMSLDEDAGAGLADAQARGAADAGVWAAWRAWDGATHGLDPADRLATHTDTFNGTIAVTRIARIGPRLWWIASTARAPRPVGTRTVEHGSALSLWLSVDPLEPDAAVLATGPVILTDHAAVSGDDTPLPGWPGGPPPAAPGTGIAVVDTTLVSGARGRVVGTPAVDPRPGLATGGALATLLRERAAIVARADITLGASDSLAPAPVAAGARCLAGPANWGDPRRSAAGGAQCISRFVIVHAPGDLRLTGGVGQGVLVVDGFLRMDGDAMFAGIVIARRGAILDAASSIRGVLAVGDTSTVAAVRLSDGASIVRSRGTIAAAIVGSSLLLPMTPGGWLGLW